MWSSFSCVWETLMISLSENHRVFKVSEMMLCIFANISIFIKINYQISLLNKVSQKVMSVPAAPSLIFVRICFSNSLNWSMDLPWNLNLYFLSIFQKSIYFRECFESTVGGNCLMTRRVGWPSMICRWKILKFVNFTKCPSKKNHFSLKKRWLLEKMLIFRFFAERVPVERMPTIPEVQE